MDMIRQARVLASSRMREMDFSIKKLRQSSFRKKISSISDDGIYKME